MNVKSIGYKFYKTTFELKQLYVSRLMFFGAPYGFKPEKNAFFASLDDCPF